MPSASLNARSSNCVSTSGGGGRGGRERGGLRCWARGWGDGEEYVAGNEAKMSCIAPACVHAIPWLL